MEEKTFTKGKIPKAFIRFAIPAVFANLLMISSFIVDAIFVGQFIGAKGLAAVQIVFPIFSMVVAVGLAIAAGSSTLVGKYLGEKNDKSANHVFNLAISLSVILSVTISGTVLFFADDIITLLDTTGSLYDSTKEFFSIILLFFGFIMVNFVLEFFVRNEGNSVYPLKVTGIGTVINIVLTFSFLSYFGMGLGGAALATGIATVFTTTMLAAYFLRRKTILQFGMPIFRISTIKKILYNGSSESLSEFSSAFVILIFNFMLLQYLGEVGVAAIAIISFISLSILMINVGFAMALQPMVSYNFGAKLKQRVLDILKIATKLSIGMGIVFYLLVLFFGDSFIGLFNNQDEHLTELTFDAIQIYGLSYIFIGINLLASAYLTALGQPKYSLIVSLSYTFVFVLIGLSVFPQFLGASGLWWAVPFANIISIIVSFYFIKKVNRKLDVL